MWDYTGDVHVHVQAYMYIHVWSVIFSHLLDLCQLLAAATHIIIAHFIEGLLVFSLNPLAGTRNHCGHTPLGQAFFLHSSTRWQLAGKIRLLVL